MIKTILMVAAVYLTSLFVVILGGLMTVYLLVNDNPILALIMVPVTIVVGNIVYVGMGAHFGVSLLKGVRK